MNCYYHSEAPVVAYCRDCGRPLCELCQRREGATVFCPEHAPATSSAGANPYASSGPVPPPPGVAGSPVSTSPALAFALGFIPGVGAIYNGQYLKGLIHAVVFGAIITLLSSNDNSPVAPLFGILLATFSIYMPFEAFHTAKKRRAGLPVDEWSSFSSASGPAAPFGGTAQAASPLPTAYMRRRTSAGPVILIGMGVLFLLDTLDLIRMHEIMHFWPVILIAVGAYQLYTRVNPPTSGVSNPTPWNDTAVKTRHE